MKTKSFIAMSLMAALAAGCSSDDIVDDGGKKPGMTDGKAYVALNIMMPSTNGSRATENFDAGATGEYKVNDVTVTYFASADGKNPRFTRTYQADELSITTGTNDITSEVTLPVEVVPFSGDAYALVEINNPGITVNAATNDVVENIDDVTYFTGESKNDFFMTNTVMKDGTYLAKVTTSDTKEAAIDNAPNNAIYVERAVGKVNLCVATGTEWGAETGKEKIYTIPSGVNANATVEISAWKLDITNKKMFPIRKFDTNAYESSVYPRFYGSKDWRTYWAQDPNYDDYTPDNKEDNFIFITSAADITNAVGVKASPNILPDNEYCLENTFDTKHQKQDETTRVLVKAVYTPAKSGFSTGSDWFSLASSTDPYTETEIKNMIKTALGTTNEVTLNFTSAGKKEKIGTGSFTVTGQTTTDEDVNKVIAAIGETISYYKGGVCYYPIRIKHLAEDCPWGAEKNPAAYDDYLEGSKEIQYLGRYGVVRNNWYQICIKSVSQPGSPEIPAPTTDQDDVKDNYLDAQINILDWAVRYQGVEL